MKEDIKLIKDLEEAKRLLIEFNEEIEKQDKEIERLNNIINKFDNYLVSVKNGCIYNVDEFLYKVVSNIYNKFQELKGDDKE